MIPASRPKAGMSGSARVADVKVIGAGPAGLMAAEVLAEAGHKVTIHDHMPAPARKFLLAGRGGLNLTHSEPLDAVLERYGEAKDFLAPAINAFPPDALIQWANGLGIETFVGSSGRVFPKQMKASPLLRAWLRRLEGLGVTLVTRSRWEGFDGTPTILALGGASWPHLGSDAAWLPIFAAKGITVHPFKPANSSCWPKCASKWLPYLKRNPSPTPKTLKNKPPSSKNANCSGSWLKLSGASRKTTPALKNATSAPRPEKRCTPSTTTACAAR
jgi:hypothetical protein